MSDHDDVHDRARGLANAISGGMNCWVSLRKTAKANESPPPQCAAELDDLERAFEVVRGGFFETDFVADDALMADTRRLRALVADWLKSGQVPKEVIPQLEGLLERLGISISYLDSEA
ncbi:MAG TPA: hypothetical protein PK156_02445 [Polyangium sp.]|nr:hypothetical protein [Polyangium sp.]